MKSAKIITEIKRLLELGAYNASLIAKESPSAEEDYNAIRQFIDSGALEKLKIEATQPCTIHAVSESYFDKMETLVGYLEDICENAPIGCYQFELPSVVEEAKEFINNSR